MTIPAVETLHHRRAFCISRFYPPRALSSTRTPSPFRLDPSLDIPTQRISRASCSPHLRIRREERKQRLLETQAAVPFSQVANFHSRKLPPLGAHAHNLDHPFGNTDPFHVGQMVRVRHFLEQDNHWTDWEIGIIVEKSRFHGYAGTNARGYIVRCINQDTGQSIEGKYAAFLAEICGINDPEPDITPEECGWRRKNADWIYTRLPIPEMINDVSMSRIWVPAYVLSWSTDNRIRISVRAGLRAGQEFDVTEALSYTPEAANACRLAGYYVMEIDGRLTKPPGRPVLIPVDAMKLPPSFSGFQKP